MKISNNNLILAICVALSLTACSPNMTAEQYLAQAKDFSEKRDHSSAIIALKNAVRLNAKDASIRYALGAAYLAQGDYISAEKELERAEKLGSDNALLTAKLVQAKLKLSKFDYVYQIAEQSETYPDAAQVIILTYAGIASIHQGKSEQAKEYIEQAIGISDDSVYGGIGKAYLSHSGNNFQNGLATIDELLASTPDFAEAVLLKGYLLQASEKFEAAARTFEQYAKLRPKDIPARLFIAQNYVFAQKFDVAEAHVDLLLKISKSHPLANQLKAEIEYSRDNFKTAKDYAVTSFQEDDSFNVSKIIAGMSAYKLGDYEQSYRYLISVKGLLPPQHLVRKLIIDLQLKLGYDTEAVSELQFLVDQNVADPAMLTMASNKMLNSGNLEAAQELLQSSIDVNTSNPRELAKQGITQLRLNQVDKGIARLEQVLKLDPELAFAEQGLAIGYIGNKQYDKAVEIAKKWQLDDDKKVQGYLLESLVLDKQKNVIEAQKLLNKVLTLDSNNVGALYKLATYAHQDKDIDLAFNYYTQVLKKQPQHIRAMINYTRLVSSTLTQSKEYLIKAVNFYESELVTKPENNHLKLGLASIFKLDKNYQAAIRLFQTIASSSKPIDGIDIALGDVYRAQGDWQAAINSYKKVVNLNPKDLRSTLKLVAIYEQIGQFNKGLQQLNKSLAVNQDNAGLLLLKSYYQSKLKIEPDQVDLEKIKVSKNTVNHWLLDKTLANIAYNKKDFSLAARYYASAYEKKPDDSNAINWSKSVAINSDKNKALEILKEHLAGLIEGQTAIAVKVMLAGAYIKKENFLEAVTLYESILQTETENIIALNNLSYLELKNGNVKKALFYSKNSVKIISDRKVENKGDHAAVIDTYAQALVANKQLKLALEQYDKAISLDVTNIELHINKAEALIIDNRNDQAKSLLSSLKTNNKQEQVRIKQLLNGL